MAQVPMAMRETSSGGPGIPADGMLRSRYFGLLPTIQLLLSSAMVSNAGYPLIANARANRFRCNARRRQTRQAKETRRSSDFAARRGRKRPAREGLRRGHERRAASPPCRKHGQEDFVAQNEMMEQRRGGVE